MIIKLKKVNKQMFLSWSFQVASILTLLNYYLKKSKYNVDSKNKWKANDIHTNREANWTHLFMKINVSIHRFVFQISSWISTALLQFAIGLG